MTHLKIWLLVGLSITMAGLVWLLPQEEQKRTQALQQQLAPLKTSRSLQQYFYQQQQKLLARTQHIANHSKVVQSMQPLAEVATSDRWNWKERQAHKQAIKALEQHLASFRKVALQRKLYIFSHQQRILLENGEVIPSFHHEHPMARLPVVEAAKRGQSLWGLWSQSDQTFLVASTPIWGKAETVAEDTSSKKETRQITGMVMLMQPISPAMMAEWKPVHATHSKHMVMIFTDRHPLFYYTTGTQTPKTKAPHKHAKNTAHTNLSQLEQEFKHWSARQFAHLTQDAQQGLFVSHTPIQLQQQAFHYIVGQMTAPISNGQVGYVLLAPVAQSTLPFYQSSTFLMGMVAIVFAILLGFWASASWHSQQKQLQIVLADFSVNPESLRSVKQLPASFSFLFQYLRTITHRMQQGSAPSYEKPAAAGQQVSSPGTEGMLMPKDPSRVTIHPEANGKPQNTLEAIRKLSADGSLVLPQRPKGMTYFHQSAKDEAKREASPLDMLRHDMESEPLDIKSTPSTLGSVRTNESNTPLPRSFTMPSQEDSLVPKSLYSSDASAIASSLMNVPEPVGIGVGGVSGLGVPVPPSALPLAPSSSGFFARQSPVSAHIPAPVVPDSALPAKQPAPIAKAPTISLAPEKERAASQLPLVSTTSSNPATSVRLAPSAPGHLNLTTELDQVFSMIASPMTPAPPSQSVNPLQLPQEQEVSIQEPAVQAPMSSEEEKMRRVFQNYLDVRKSCGEPTNIPWDNFVELLRNQKAAILQQYSCKDVNFYVQQKDGRAALKATPIH